MRRNYQKCFFQVAVLLICLVVFLFTGCNSRDGAASGEGASQFSHGKFWGHRGGAILDNANFYETIENAPNYGVVVYNVHEANDPSQYKFDIIASLQLCRNEYLEYYKNGTLTDSKHNFIQLKLQYVILLISETKPKANSNSMSDDEKLQDFCDSHKIGYVFPAADVFSESINYDELIAKAYVDKHPVAMVEQPKKDYVYKIIDNHKQAICNKQDQSKN